MRRAFVAALVAGVTLLTASACSVPPGTDGDLANQWPAMAAATGWEPKAGTCHKNFNEQSYRASYTPIECNTDHVYETVYIGQFTGAAAQGNLPDSKGSVATAALTECKTKATEFLGGDFRDGRIWVGISLPSKGSWDGGARWFRCEIAVRDGNSRGVPTTWKQSLKGEFTKDSAVKYGCYQTAKDASREPIACAEDHNGEYVGTFEMDLTYDQLEADMDSVHKRCRSVIAGYVGVPDDSQMVYRTGTSISYPSRSSWEAGDHNIQCFIYLGEKTRSSSLKGTGNAGLPAN